MRVVKRRLRISNIIFSAAFLIGSYSVANAAEGPVFGDRSPVFQRGDWSSSGDTPPPYHPSYNYSYRCQAQLSDQITRKDRSGARYQSFAIADFTIDKHHTSIDSRNLKWFHHRVYNVENIVETKDSIPFSTVGAQIWTRFEQGESSETDALILALNLSQKFGDLVVSENSQLRATRAKRSFETTLSLKVRRGSRPLPNLLLRVLCDRST